MSTPAAAAGSSTPAKTDKDKDKVRIKAPQPGAPLFGCEHLQRLFGFGANSQEGHGPVNASANGEGLSNGGLTACVQHYKTILRCIFDDVPLLAQTTKLPDGRPCTSLTPNYLCLQCPNVVTEDDRVKHGQRKQHRFYVESRSGALYCQMCDDFVWDPTLEELRIRKMGTGAFNRGWTRESGICMPPLAYLSFSASWLLTFAPLLLLSLPFHQPASASTRS
jgi:ubiquitin carboxyl-terminal hydrolase 22/27/51